jgi:hypothetical protein
MRLSLPFHKLLAVIIDLIDSLHIRDFVAFSVRDEMPNEWRELKNSFSREGP